MIPSPRNYVDLLSQFVTGSGFLYLPQCLHKIAEVYHLKEEDEKAIQFLKAEKIYYETALIDTQQMQDKIGESREISELQSHRLNKNKSCLPLNKTNAKLTLSAQRPHI